MKLLLTVPAMLVALAFGGTAGAQSLSDIQQMNEEMLYPTVLVATRGGAGSGTVLFSDEIDGEVHTYVLTNFHVVRSLVSFSEKWDGEEGENVKVERRQPADIKWFVYNEGSRAVGTAGQMADIVAYDKHNDLALLRTRNKEQAVPYVARIADDGEPLYLFERSFAVGAGLGYPPFATEGMISSNDLLWRDRTFILSSSPIIFGNSGGSLYVWDEDHYELVGVPSAVSATGWGGQAVTHMAWAIPIETVYSFLRDNDLGFIVGDAPEETGEEDEMEAPK